MDDLYKISGVSENDVVFDLRYFVIYVLREGILDLSEGWVHRPLIEQFSSYTRRNTIQVLSVTVEHDDCLVFELKLLDPNVAMEEVVDDISEMLCALLPWLSGLEVENPWCEVQIFTIGKQESVRQEVTAYIEMVRRSKPEGDG